MACEDTTEDAPEHDLSEQRSAYCKIFFGGTFLIIILIFTVFSIFWGSLWKIPVYNLQGWVVDFDGGMVGQSVVRSFGSNIGASKITWNIVPAQVVGSLDELTTLIDLTSQPVNPGASAKLSAALAVPNSSYDGSEAITAYATEARNENAFRGIIRPSVEASLSAITTSFAMQITQNVANSSVVPALLSTSPQTITSPISYTINNLLPFDVPVATAATFVGLIYQLLLSFFVVMITLTAREKSGLNDSLSFRNLILLRFASSFGAYFFLSLIYSLLNVAFHLPMTRKFGQAGFILFWMLSYVGMLSVYASSVILSSPANSSLSGLALESFVTLLTVKFIPFFMLMWIITNISVCIFPIEVLPRVFRYGYASPFYNVSRGMRTIVFGTKNELGLHFGILIVWIAISCITLPLIQCFVKREGSAKIARPDQDMKV
ncbi:hypothetical protein K443DRAFT_122793 [Laccaria amethystina LaAM-08-1]|uniref:DUF3533 domain-containing protein n=1 Tax=Laccaria amethystina LaAM-08-1 TaxID=1095629 RepID=A0A0C9XS28_9AGAR|nr:hypothetical protein K443DRAFT_122793 [Laccaria amethystina LaAM-08-1]